MRDVNLIILGGFVTTAPKGLKDAVTFKVLWIEPRKDGPDDRCELEVIAFGALGSKCADLRSGDFVECEGSMHSWREELAGKTKQFWQIKAKKVDKIYSSNPIHPKVTQTNDDWSVGL